MKPYGYKYYFLDDHKLKSEYAYYNVDIQLLNDYNLAPQINRNQQQT